MDEGAHIFIASWVMFVAIYLIYWNKQRVAALAEVEIMSKTLGRSAAENAMKTSELTYEQKMGKPMTKPPPYDITRLGVMSIEAVVKTFVTLIILWFILFVTTRIIEFIDKGSPEGIPSFISDGTAPDSSLVVLSLFELMPLFKGLLVSTVIASVYSACLVKYRENQHNATSLRLHVNVLSFLNAVSFLGIFTYYSFINNGVIKPLANSL